MTSPGFAIVLSAVMVSVVVFPAFACTGIAVAITRELGVPVKFIGIGEGMNDLRKFDPDEYVEGLFAE